MATRPRLGRPYVLTPYDREFARPTTSKGHPIRKTPLSSQKQQTRCSIHGVSPSPKGSPTRCSSPVVSPLREVDSIGIPTPCNSPLSVVDLTECSTPSASPLSQTDSTKYPSPRGTSTPVFHPYNSHPFRPQIPVGYPSRGEFEEVQAIIAPYWHIFNLVLEYEPRLRVHLDINPSPGLGKPIVICESEYPPIHGRLIQAYGPAVHDPWISPDMRRGSNKFNHCDFSIRVFLYVLEPLLSRVNARITWLAVVAKPYWVIFWKDYQPDPQVLRHSVFNIETRSGDEYIADFTIEQFGYSSECWLMRKSEYEKQCTMGIRMRQPRSEEVDEARRGEVKFWIKKAQAIWMVCQIMHHYGLGSMDDVMFVRWLEFWVKDVSLYMWQRQPAYQPVQ